MYLDWQKEAQNYWVVDIETDDLKASVIWVAVCKNIQTGEVLEFYDASSFNNWYLPGFILVGHNIVSFDIPTLRRLWEIPIECNAVCDTLVLSCLYNPGIDDGHSLAAWGRRLKKLKGEFSDFSKLSPEMVSYCRQDVEVTYELFKQLTRRMVSVGFSELSCEIEHKIRVLIDQQQQNGFYFDKLAATRLRDHLNELKSDLSSRIQSLFPPIREKVAEYPIRRTKDGRPFASYEKHRNRYSDIVEFEEYYECYELVPFNLGSPKQRVERLLSLGWKPENFTEKGFPKVDEDALLAFSSESGREEVRALAEWLVLQGRASMLDTWINNLGTDSRIHGRVNSCGATTRRMTHSSPNTANIPSGAKAKYGHECRALWGVEPNRGLVLVGYDAAGLETAGLCHYLNNPRATEVLLRNKPDDIHTSNARRLTEALGRLVDREWGAKTTWYAWLYGAGLKKLGAILKGSVSDGETVVDTFFRNVPGLKKLIKEVQGEFKANDGLLKTIDGGFVRCPSMSAALNYKIQSAGAIVMKMTSILLDEEAKKIGLPFKRVGDIHDEGQLEVHKDRAEELGALAVECISRAGRLLGFRVDLGGSYLIGENWSMTH